MANANSLKTLAREIAKAAKANNTHRAAPKAKVATSGKGWCGKHSELRTDLALKNLPKANCMFNRYKHDKGNNGALVAAICRAGISAKI